MVEKHKLHFYYLRRKCKEASVCPLPKCVRAYGGTKLRPFNVIIYAGMDTPPLQKTSTASAARLAGLVIGSVVLFMMTFASAGSWLLLVEHAIPSIRTKDTGHVKAFGLMAILLSVVTIGLALAFAFGTRDLKVKLPLDFATVIKNVQHGANKKRKPQIPFQL